MEVFRDQGKIDRRPTPETCIQWEMKLGLYKLTRPKEVADDWVWIADHVVRKGVHKCLVVLGVRMSSLEKRDDLTISFKDVEPLGIAPMRVSNGGLIEIEFEEILKSNHGIPPLAIVKDHGSDLRCGGKRFCDSYSEVIDVYDISHKIARLYERQFKNDALWCKFTKKCAQFKNQAQLTRYADIAPPNQRSKARYQNIDVLVDWATDRLLHYRELSPGEQGQLKWLKKYEQNLTHWAQLVDMGRTCRDFVRKKGLWVGCYEQLEERFAEMELCSYTDEFACDLIDFLKDQGNKVPNGKCVIGSSEIIESLFGKHKAISERGPKPMGRLILSMASRVGELPTEVLIQTAFEKIRESDVDKWLEKVFV